MAASDPVVRLPEYIIRGNRVLPRPEQWTYVAVQALEVKIEKRVVRTPGFELLSNLPHKNTRVFVEALQQRQLAGAIFWPDLVTMRGGGVPIVILDRNGRALLNSDEWQDLAWEGIDEMSPAIEPGSVDPTSEQDPIDLTSPDFRPRLHSGFEAVATGGQTANGARLVAGDLHSGRLNGSLGTAYLPELAAPSFGKSIFAPLPAGLVTMAARHGVLGFRANASLNRQEAQLAQQLGQKFVAHNWEQQSRQIPPWLNVGVASLIASTEVTATRITVGGNWRKTSYNKPPSLREVLESSDPLTPEQSDIARDFTLFCLLDSKSSHGASFRTFANRVCGTAVTEAVFKDCFGIDYADMERELWRSRDAKALGISPSRAFPIKSASVFRQMVPRPASQLEIARLQADLFLAEDSLARALDVLRVAYVRGDRPLSLIAQLADLEERAGNRDRASKLVEAATAQPDPPARALFTLARLRFREATAGLHPLGSLPAQVTVSILGLLSQAAQKGLRSEELYALAAAVVRRSRGRPASVVISFLKDGADLYPRNVEIHGTLIFVAEQRAAASPRIRMP